MKVRHFLAGLLLSVLLSACAAIRGGGDVDQGRQALLAGNYQAALCYFQTAEQTDPNYMYGAELREGVLSFLGRTQYLTGNFAQARYVFRDSARWKVVVHALLSFPRIRQSSQRTHSQKEIHAVGFHRAGSREGQGLSCQDEA